MHATTFRLKAQGQHGYRRTLKAGSAAQTFAMRSDGKIGVLFVCLGNICRSPSAEAVFKKVVEREGLADRFFIDSCGTGGGNHDWYVEGGWSYHEGDPSDERMSATAKKRGIVLTSRSRPLKPVDFNEFDYIIGMEAKNVRAMQTAAEYWSTRKMGQGIVPSDYKNKLSLMTDYCITNKGISAVPDPYYSGQDAFEKVLDLLDDACTGLLQHISEEKNLATSSTNA